MSVDSVVELGEVELDFAGVMTGSKKLCSASHLLAFSVKIRRWPEYKEYYIDFELQGGAWLSIAMPEDEFKKFVKLLNKVIEP